MPVYEEPDGTLEGIDGVVDKDLASALLANGVHFVARSMKYHRPRGIVGSGAEEPNAIVQVGIGARTVPNLRATQVELGHTPHDVGHEGCDRPPPTQHGIDVRVD